MKKTWIIIGGTVALFILLGLAWWYLLMNGRPEALSNIPNPFSGGSGAFPASTDGDRQGTPSPVFATSLKQISDGQVAGAVFVERNGLAYVRYAERGTGHIFEYDTRSGSTVRLTNTTIPRATEA